LKVFARKEERRVRVFLIQDSEGRLVGTAPSGVQEVKTSPPGVPVSKGAEEEALQVEIESEPLPGQRVHELELPSELEGLDDANELLKALSGYRLMAGEAKLVQRGS
jgi:hypothetical protein